MEIRPSNTWPPLLSGTSTDPVGREQLYGKEVIASDIIQADISDVFFNPKELKHTGFASDGVYYHEGEALLGHVRASWYLEDPGPYRGAKPAFPSVGIVLATDAGISILDRANEWALWMLFIRADHYAYTNNFLNTPSGFHPVGVSYKAGRVVVSLAPDAGSMYQASAALVLDYVADRIYIERPAYKPPVIGPYHYPDVKLLPKDVYPLNTPYVDLVAGNKPLWWSITPKLPTGMFFDSRNGHIWGTPTENTGEIEYTITGTNPGGSGTTTIKIEVGRLALIPTIGPYKTIIASLNEPIAPTSPKMGPELPKVWAAPDGLPTGITLDTATGTLTGTPLEEAGNAWYPIRGTNDSGSATAMVRIYIYQNKLLDSSDGSTPAILTEA